MSNIDEDLYVVDPEGDIIVDIIRTGNEEDIGWDSSEEYESDGFDEYNPGGEYFLRTGQDLHFDPEDDRGPPPQEEYNPSGEFSSYPNDDETGSESDTNLEPDKPKKLRTSFKVSSKCLSLGSGYFKALFRHKTWTESQHGRYEIHAAWGFKAFKILMQIAHLQFIKIPDQLGINTMVKLAMAADYLMMIPLLNPWIFRWGLESPLPWTGRRRRLEDTQKYDMKLLYINLQLGYGGGFRSSFNKLITYHGPDFETFGLPVPQKLVDSLIRSREQKIRKLLSTLRDITNIYVYDAHLLETPRWCSTQCKNDVFGQLMIQLHNRGIYPRLPDPSYDPRSYYYLEDLITVSMEEIEATGCRSARDSGPICSFRWALPMFQEINLPDSDKLGEFVSGWEQRQLKTWVMYRRGRYLDTDNWIKARHE